MKRSKAQIYWLISALLVLAVVLYVVVSLRGPRYSVPARAYFIDEETGTETIERTDVLPPLPGASGKPTRVRAICFTVDGGKTHQVAYLERFSDDAKAVMAMSPEEQQAPENQEKLRYGHEIRVPGPEGKWVPMQSGAGEEIQFAYRAQHGAGAKLYYPR